MVAQDGPVRVWILTVKSELEGESAANYLYELGASYGDLLSTL